MEQSDLAVVHPSERWRELVHAAVLGLDRAGLTTLEEKVPWRVGNDDASGDASDSYLAEVAALGLYELAGRHPDVVESAAPPRCELPDRVCPCRAAHHLAEILQTRPELLGEWCQMAIAGGWRAPPELVPALLDRAAVARDGNERALLLEVAGNRGNWLAPQNPAWESLLISEEPSSREETWNTGSHAERLTVLRNEREADADRAMAWLTATWGSEPADQRASFVSALASTLRPEDEEFLEKCLTDRSKGVREAAAHLLSRLTDSAFSQRMVERAERVVRYVPGGGRIKRKVATVEVELTTDVEDALQRDGLAATAQGKLGAKGSLLSQLVAHAPLAVWDGAGASSAEWIVAAKQSDWTVALLDGWLGATALQGNVQWGETLLKEAALVAGEASDLVGSERRSAVVANIMSSLSPEEGDRLALDVLTNRDQRFSPVAIDEMLVGCDFPWSRKLSAMATQHLAQRLQTPLSYDYTLRTLVAAVPLRVDPGVADQLALTLEKVLPQLSAGLAEQLQQALATLRFRREFRLDLTP